MQKIIKSRIELKKWFFETFYKVICGLLISSSVGVAGLDFTVKGKVLRVEKGFAILKTNEGEQKIDMKLLSKKNIKKILNASGYSKEITLKLPSVVPSPLQTGSQSTNDL